MDKNRCYLLAGPGSVTRGHFKGAGTLTPRTGSLQSRGGGISPPTEDENESTSASAEGYTNVKTLKKSLQKNPLQYYMNIEYRKRSPSITKTATTMAGIPYNVRFAELRHQISCCNIGENALVFVYHNQRLSPAARCSKSNYHS